MRAIDLTIGQRLVLQLEVKKQIKALGTISASDAMELPQIKGLYGDLSEWELTKAFYAEALALLNAGELTLHPNSRFS